MYSVKMFSDVGESADVTEPLYCITDDGRFDYGCPASPTTVPVKSRSNSSGWFNLMFIYLSFQCLMFIHSQDLKCVRRDRVASAPPPSIRAQRLRPTNRSYAPIIAQFTQPVDRPGTIVLDNRSNRLSSVRILANHCHS